MEGLAWRDGASGFLEVDGNRIEYGMWGPAPGTGKAGSLDAAPTIVLLHEGLGCVALWRDFPEQLARATSCGVFAFSRPGYGQSDPKPLPWPLNYMSREAADTLAPVLNALAAPAVVLVGHSDGATIAAIHAGSVEDRRLWGVVLMAPHFFTEPEGLASIAGVRTAYDGGDLRVRLGKYHRDPDNCFRGWNDSWLHPEFRDWNVSDCLDYVRVPVLVVQGEDDQYGSVAQVDEVAGRCYAPVDVMMLPSCRHAPHFDQTEATLAGIASFCDRLRKINA